MTASAASVRRLSAGDSLRRALGGPVEGWLSLAAVVVMVDVLALSLVNAGWTGNIGTSSFLPWLAVGGTLFGAAGAKVGWGRWRTYLVGALFGGLLIPLVVGGVLLAQEPGWDPAGLATRMAESFKVIRTVWNDFVVLQQSFTREYGYYHLIFGALIWAAGLLAGASIFGHRRPLDLVVTLGLVLLVNVALTSNDQLFLLEIYTAASLLLLIRTHVFEEQITWLRRKIGDPASVSQLYLNGGAMFVTLAMIGAITLTTVASSAPLQGLFSDLPTRLQDLAALVNRFAPPGGNPNGIGGVSFLPNSPTTGFWNPSGGVAFRAQLPRTEADRFKWRVGVFSVYDNGGWRWAPDTRTEPTEARATLLAGDTAGDAPVTDGRRQVDFRISVDGFVSRSIVSPNMVQSVDRATNAIVAGADGWFTTVETTDGSRAYSVTALVPDPDADVITEANLRTASTDYPDEVRALYLGLPQGAMGARATDVLTAIKASISVPSYADPKNPFDLARAIESYLRSPTNFKYDPDVRDETHDQCGNASTVECFAIIRRGYCDYYASMMAVFLRHEGVPARIAYGFLPGPRSSDGNEVVSATLAHYWVEVYFPGYGWIDFDPTGGNGAVAAAIPSGAPPSAAPSNSARPTASAGAPRTPSPTSGTGGGTTDGSPGIGPFIAIALILVVGLVLLVYAVARRAPRKPMHPDQAWGSLARLASRIGLGPRPSQTVFEYAGALGDAVPDARVELTTIARAKVEVAYGRRDLGGDRLKRIAEAYQRLRFALFGVIVRRGLRLRMPGSARRRR